jgi:hypothetical protein
VIAILGAASALAGLTLVFLGMIVSDYQARAESSPDAASKSYFSLAWMILVAFAASIACVGLATVWMLAPHGVRFLYVPVVTIFLASLVMLLVATLIVVRRLVARRA